MMMWLFLQTTPTIPDAVPQWVGSLGGPALAGVLVYYLITTTIPKLHDSIKELQDKFHSALDRERESREALAEKTFQEHREAIRAIIEKDERHHDRVMAAIDLLPGRMRSQV